MQYDILEAFLLFLLNKKFGDFKNTEKKSKEMLAYAWAYLS